ncbi:MAG: glutamate--tRNA ligase [Bacteroidales bacterium]
MSDKKPRVRFAPSPTGPLHIGGVRTALFNYLFARKHNGTFILRIEDTDQQRFKPGTEEYIIEALNWCGITIDEGVSAGGPHAPYRQSERKEVYLRYAMQLIEKGHAYYAFDTAEEIDELRKIREKEGGVFKYDYNERNYLRNSLSMSGDELDQLLSDGTPYVIRFLIPADNELVINDIIRGEITVNSATLDDKVLFKSDGMPTYHLANVVDDYLMQITHVIRGEEWLPSLPLHVLLYRAFGWTASMPEFAHLPLLLKPGGQGKLSKRDGDTLGFPVFPLKWEDPATREVSAGYRESGYFPQAFVNLLALLGWNPGTEKEIFSMKELAEAFSLERVNNSGARFDPEKARWFNHQYLVNMDDRDLATYLMIIAREKGYDAEMEKLEVICGLIKERAHFVSEIWEQGLFFFERPETYDESVVRKKWKPNTPELLGQIAGILNDVSPFTSDTISEMINGHFEKAGVGMGQVMIPLRIALVGESKGPGLFTIIELLGREESISRIRLALERIKV